MVSNLITSKEFGVEFSPKAPIKCKVTASNEALQANPALIFTHGAGGGLQAPAVANFASGFANVRPIVCFQGTMNLASRTKMFEAVCQHQRYVKCLGGRSMGARAAVMAASKETTHLVLVSYPLHTDKETRDRILLDIPENVKVIFVSGDRDSMCDLRRLEEVRAKMKCESWQLTVIGADHGMNVKPKSGTTDMGRMTGEAVAKWLACVDHITKEASIQWDPEESQVEWVGWVLPGNIGERKSEVGQSATGFLPSVETDCTGEQRETDKNEEIDTSKATKKRKTTDDQPKSRKSTKKPKRKH